MVLEAPDGLELKAPPAPADHAGMTYSSRFSRAVAMVALVLLAELVLGFVVLPAVLALGVGLLAAGGAAALAWV